MERMIQSENRVIKLVILPGDHLWMDGGDANDDIYFRDASVKHIKFGFS